MAVTPAAAAAAAVLLSSCCCCGNADGGRWRALHHQLQSLFAPTMVSVWIEWNKDLTKDMLHVYASHHGAARDQPAQLELNITKVATGATTSQLFTLNATVGATAAIAPVVT